MTTQYGCKLDEKTTIVVDRDCPPGTWYAKTENNRITEWHVAPGKHIEALNIMEELRKKGAL